MARSLSASVVTARHIANKVSTEPLQAALWGTAPSLALCLFMYTGQVNWEFNYQAVRWPPSPSAHPASTHSTSSFSGCQWGDSAIITMLYDSSSCPLLLCPSPVLSPPYPPCYHSNQTSRLAQLTFWNIKKHHIQQITSTRHSR